MLYVVISDDQRDEKPQAGRLVVLRLRFSEWPPSFW